jgi:hypothetical protein
MVASPALPPAGPLPTPLRPAWERRGGGNRFTGFRNLGTDFYSTHAVPFFTLLEVRCAIDPSRSNSHSCVDVPAATIRGCHFHLCGYDLALRDPVFTFTFMADLNPPPAAAAAAAAAAVAAPPAPADALAALRARASFLGAPLEVFEPCLEKYVLFAEGGAPKIVIQEGVFLEKAATIEAAYVPYFRPVWDATASRLKLKCVCCKTGPISYHVVGAKLGAKHTFPFSNALDHLKRCPGLPPLLPDHIADRKAAKQESPQPQPEKRPRILDEPSEHLGCVGGVVTVWEVGGWRVRGRGRGGKRKFHFSLFSGVAPRHNRVLCFTFTLLTRGALEKRTS